MLCVRLQAAGPRPRPPPGQIEEVLTFPANITGLVIGRSGATVKNMRDAVGVKMVVDNAEFQVTQGSVYGSDDGLPTANTFDYRVAALPLPNVPSANDVSSH